jgi:hypothetical protein
MQPQESGRQEGVWRGLALIAGGDEFQSRLAELWGIVQGGRRMLTSNKKICAPKRSQFFDTSPTLHVSV